jgi:outer membrane protein assembly factor BamB
MLPSSKGMTDLIIGIKGTVLAIDISTGVEKWTTHLHGKGFVHVLLDGGQLFAATHGMVFRVDPTSGEIQWQASVGSDFVSLVLYEGHLFASCQGELSCLDPTTGELRWKNELKGMGFGLITIAQATDGNRSVVEEKQRRDEEAASADAGTDLI